VRESDSAICRRNSIRLRGYDYSSTGAYFVTICARHRQCLFGDIVDATMWLSEAGQVIQTVWNALPKRFANIVLDISVVMPNHVHGIIVRTDSSDVGGRARPARLQGRRTCPSLQQGRSKRRPYIGGRNSDIQNNIRHPGESCVGPNRPAAVAT
jgi:REP element-mobilizing transposase RayT